MIYDAWPHYGKHVKNCTRSLDKEQQQQQQQQSLAIEIVCAYDFHICRSRVKGEEGGEDEVGEAVERLMTAKTSGAHMDTHSESAATHTNTLTVWQRP